ncbi:hypothetical protein DPMN_099599 [Dreissena polymorpha]|uniref:Uncharacterized protein n=1 Tax=Dreissena polymorpha TaxID=45954 RepID=A0A9D4LE74_DREPO|nr:hypothetical protein DPMN_099599 [Dreissena polymorpha]
MLTKAFCIPAAAISPAATLFLRKLGPTANIVKPQEQTKHVEPEAVTPKTPQSGSDDRKSPRSGGRKSTPRAKEEPHQMAGGDASTPRSM